MYLPVFSSAISLHLSAEDNGGLSEGGEPQGYLHKNGKH